jgi:hypothetical protein
MMPKLALHTAAAVFTLVSLLHWVRFVLGTQATLGGTAASLVLGIVSAGLAAWMIFASRKV